MYRMENYTVESWVSGPGPGAKPGLAGGKNDRTDLSFKCVPTVIILWMREGEKKYYPKERTYVSPYNRM